MLSKEQIKEKLKNDPFIKMWKENYVENYSLGNFSSPRTKPLMYLYNTTPYQNIPIVLIVAGPSLDKNIEKLKEYQNNCIIICADVVLYKLMDHNIKPDFVVNIDPHESISRFWKFLDTKNYVLVCPTTTNPKTLSEWKGNILLFNQIDIAKSPKGEALKKIIKPTIKWGNIFNQYFIGATMLQFCTLLNPTKIILMGYDFAYTNEKAYCSGFLDLKIYHLEDEPGTKEHTEMIEKLKNGEVHKDIQLNAIGGGTVWSTKQLQFYKNTFVKLGKPLKDKIINSTEGGALLEFPIIPLHQSLKDYCSYPIKKKNIWVQQKRKKRKRK